MPGPSPVMTGLALLLCAGVAACVTPAAPSHDDTPEVAVRRMLQANAEKNLALLEQLVARDMVGYTIGGRRYDGWSELARDMELEFESASHIEIPIKELRVWERGDVAWYTAEIDYLRREGVGPAEQRTVLPLRESGVLERRDGRWVLVQWHESPSGQPRHARAEGLDQETSRLIHDGTASLSIAGEWDIHEEDRSYRAVLDAAGNGTYDWQNGTIRTVRVEGLQWEGQWHQGGNDREGGFEVTLSPDHASAQGRWWYTRVGNREVPPRQWGGEYRFTRLRATPAK